MLVNRSSRSIPGKIPPSAAPKTEQRPPADRPPSGPALSGNSAYAQAKAPAAAKESALSMTVPGRLSRSSAPPDGAEVHTLLPNLEGYAEREMLPVQQDQVVDFVNDRDQRRNMLRSCPQNNEVAASKGGCYETREVDGKTVEIPVGSGPYICGGAAVTNALVLSSKTPEQAAKNAAAIEKVAADLKVPLLPAESEALKRFASGKMSPRDAQQLHQVLMNLGRAGGEPNSTSGISREQMAGLLARLSKEGAFAGSTVQMHLNSGHWTCTCDGTHVDSQGPRNSKTGRDTAVVQGGPPVHVNRQRESWEGDVTLHGQWDPPSIELALLNKSDPTGTARFVTFDVEDYQPPTNSDVGNSTSPLYKRGQETAPTPR